MMQMNEKTQKWMIRFAMEHKKLTAVLAVVLLLGIGACLFFGDGSSGGGNGQQNVMSVTPAEGSGNQKEPTISEEPVTPTVTLSESPTPTVTLSESPTPTVTLAESPTPTVTPAKKQYTFRNKSTMQSHFEKHGHEFPYDTVEDYVAGANRVIYSSEALHKFEKEDGDDIYYLEESNEFVVVSTDGYIRTYFRPSNGKSYFDRQ